MEFLSVDPQAARVVTEIFSGTNIRECRVCEGEFGIRAYGAVQRGNSSVQRFKVFGIAFAKPFEKVAVSAGIGCVAFARPGRTAPEFSCQGLGYAFAALILDFENTLEREIAFFGEINFPRVRVK